MVNLSIGQCSIFFGDNEIVFTPSFKNISNIGEPEDILTHYRDITNKDTSIFNAVAISYLVLSELADKPIPNGMLPEVVLSYDRKRELIKTGAVEIKTAILIAADLLAKGVIGKSKKPKKSGPLATSFNALEYIGSAVANLGIQPSEAWDMTLIEFQKAIEAKFPDSFSQNQESGDEVKAFMDALEGKGKMNRKYIV